MLLVCADGGVSAERNSVMHRYSGHFCTCGVSPYVSSEFSSLRGKRRLQESPQPVCHPGEAQTRKKSSITLVKGKIPSNYSSKREEKQELVIPFEKEVFVWEDAEQLQGGGFSYDKGSGRHSK